MKGFKSYFRTHLKEKSKEIIFIASIVLVFTIIIGVTSHTVIKRDEALDIYVTTYYARIYIPVMFAIVMALIVPVVEFGFFKKRTNLDCAYALPISRKAIGLVHYLTGAIIVLGTYVLSYVVNILLLLPLGVHNFHFYPMLPHFFLCIPLILAVYTFMTFAFTEANSTSDGLMFMFQWGNIIPFVLIVVLTSVHAFEEFILKLVDLFWNSFIIGCVSSLTSYYSDLVDYGIVTNNFPHFWSSWADISSYFAWILIGIASGIRFYLHFGNTRAERTEEISNSWFGYRTLLPIYGIGGMVLFNDSIFLKIFTIILCLGGYCIFRRGFHFKKSDIVIFAILGVLFFI